jgi:hypothetical protein
MNQVNLKIKAILSSETSVSTRKLHDDITYIEDHCNHICHRGNLKSHFYTLIYI